MSVKKAASAAIMAACLSAGLTTVAAPAAQAAPVKACVKKKTGELRVLLKSKKKCKKGWKKVSWNEAGDPGAAGPQGPVVVRNVKDATGAVIGYTLLSAYSGLSGGVLVYSEGGAYWYSASDGKVEDSGSVYYTDAACSAAVTPVYHTPHYLAALNSFGRVVDRPNSAAPTRAYKGTSTVLAAGEDQQFWYLEEHNATCKSTGMGWLSTYAVLEAVPAPADRPGPLSIE